MKVKVKKFSDAAILPCYAHDGEDAAMDLYCVDYEYDQYNNIVYKTGLGFEIPTGYVGLLFPRSSNCKTDLLLTNSVGVIDSGYIGEIILKYKIVNKDGNYILKHEIGERVGQIMIIPYPHIELDLDRQSQRLSEYCANNNLYVEHIIKDCGSGLNDKRYGFTQLTDLVIKGKVNKVIIEHKDRLTRFQYNFIEKMFNTFGCGIISIDDKDDVSDTEELTRDLMALLASFSGKYYGRRSIERRKKK